MFAWDVEGRIGMVAGLWGVRDQTSCPEDFAPVLLLGAGPGPHPCALQLGATHRNQMQTGLQRGEREVWIKKGMKEKHLVFGDEGKRVRDRVTV